MSNEALNTHIKLGEPCGEDADLATIADWLGTEVLDLKTEVARLNEVLANRAIRVAKLNDEVERLSELIWKNCVEPASSEQCARCPIRDICGTDGLRK